MGRLVLGHEQGGGAPRRSGTEPVRTCVGCRRRDRRSVLLRVVAEPGPDGHQLVPDPERVRPGRGASLHLDQDCLAAAVTRRAFARALRLNGAADASSVVAFVAADRQASDWTAPGRPDGESQDREQVDE